jgi:hypothetical protein
MYKITSLFLFISLVSFSQSPKINGIGFVSSDKPISQSNVKPLVNINANYVALNPFAIIKDLNSPQVIFNSKHQWFCESSKGIKQYANEFKNSEIKIMLKPQIWVLNGKFTGFIKMKTEADWLLFEESYRKFILDYAQIATDINANVFCIGVELEQFTINRPKFWVQLINEIKEVYTGELTYASNWDEYKRISFWNQLDYIGVDAYFPLSDLKNPSALDLSKGWKVHKEGLLKTHEKFEKPILFTEYGYRSVDYTGKEPWDSASKTESETNLNAQTNAMVAVYHEFWTEHWFAGGFLWKWFPNHSTVGGHLDNRFTPQNKPAQKIIKFVYGGEFFKQKKAH